MSQLRIFKSERMDTLESVVNAFLWSNLKIRVLNISYVGVDASVCCFILYDELNADAFKEERPDNLR